MQEAEEVVVIPGKDRVNAFIATRKEAPNVLVSFRWGIEYTTTPTAEQKSLAHLAVDAGANLVLGAHPHVLQGLELYHDKLIAYSLDNFVFDDHSQPAGAETTLRLSWKRSGRPPVGGEVQLSTA